MYKRQAQDTEYILLDEPTNNLDIYHATNLMKTVRRLCDELGKTVILVLHEINYAAFYSDYICAFKDGRIARFGSVEEVITSENLSAIYGVEFQIQTVKGKPLSIYLSLIHICGIKRLKWFDFALLAAVTLLCNFGPDSRAATMCLCVLMVAALVVRIWPVVLRPLPVRILLAAAPVLAFAASMILAFLWNPDNPVLAMLDPVSYTHLYAVLESGIPGGHTFFYKTQLFLRKFHTVFSFQGVQIQSAGQPQL